MDKWTVIKKTPGNKAIRSVVYDCIDPGNSKLEVFLKKIKYEESVSKLIPEGEGYGWNEGGILLTLPKKEYYNLCMAACLEYTKQRFKAKFFKNMHLNPTITPESLKRFLVRYTYLLMLNIYSLFFRNCVVRTLVNIY